MNFQAYRDSKAHMGFRSKVKAYKGSLASELCILIGWSLTSCRIQHAAIAAYCLQVYKQHACC